MVQVIERPKDKQKICFKRKNLQVENMHIHNARPCPERRLIKHALEDSRFCKIFMLNLKFWWGNNLPSVRVGFIISEVLSFWWGMGSHMKELIKIVPVKLLHLFLCKRPIKCHFISSNSRTCETKSQTSDKHEKHRNNGATLPCTYNAIYICMYFYNARHQIYSVPQGGYLSPLFLAPTKRS